MQVHSNPLGNYMFLTKPHFNIGDYVIQLENGLNHANGVSDLMIVFVHLDVLDGRWRYQAHEARDTLGIATWPAPFDDVVELPDIPIPDFVTLTGRKYTMKSWTYTWCNRPEALGWRWHVVSETEGKESWWLPEYYNQLAALCTNATTEQAVTITPILYS